MLRISFIILIVGICLFPLATLFEYLETTLTNEIWEVAKSEPIGNMTLNAGESHSFEFTVLAENHIVMHVDVEPEGESLMAQYFSLDGKLIKEQKIERLSGYVMSVRSPQYTAPHFEYGKTYSGVFENFNDRPVSFYAFLTIEDQEPRPTDYMMLRYLAAGLSMVFIPVLVLGGIIFVIQIWKKKKQTKKT